MSYLLDTNAWSKHLGTRPSPVKARVLACGVSSLRLCSIVKSELIYGAYRSPKPEVNFSLLASLFSEIESVPFDDAAAEHAGRVRSHLDGLGLPIGPNDLLIAATALVHGLTLVTHNLRECSRVPGLVIEDWQAE